MWRGVQSPFHEKQGLRIIPFLRFCCQIGEQPTQSVGSGSTTNSQYPAASNQYPVSSSQQPAVSGQRSIERRIILFPLNADCWLLVADC
jgi:hypothetical protein